MAKFVSGAFINERVYIPRGNIKFSRVKKNFEFRHYKEETCKKCENRELRFNDICSTCPAYLGHFQMWDKHTIKGKPFVSITKGDIENIESKLKVDLSNVKDKRALPPVRHKIKFTKKLFHGQVEGTIKRANQKKLINDFRKAGTGIIEAPPRTGKTVIGVALTRLFRTRTLIVANDSTLLDQFLKTIYAFTDAKKLEKETGKRVAGIVKKMSDFDKGWDITLTTYQKFIRGKKGEKRIKRYILDKFGFIIVDECFPDGTQVTMSDGNKKSIENITTGDYVMSYNHNHQTWEPKPVINTRRIPLVENKKLIRINHEHGSFVCTEDHPIWCDNRKQYVKACDLTPQDLLLLNIRE